MARGVNKVILIGNLGNDPEVRYTPNGNAVANVNLATSETWRDKQSGDLQDRTEWHRIVFFNRLAEIVGEYLHKGSKIYVEGSLRTRKWTDRNGIERHTTEIISNEMHMLDSRGGGGGGGSNKYSDKSHEHSKQAPATESNKAKPAAPEAATTGTGGPAAEKFVDDDIPF